MLTTLVQALMSLASFWSLRRRSPEWAAAREESQNWERQSASHERYNRGKVFVGRALHEASQTALKNAKL